MLKLREISLMHSLTPYLLRVYDPNKESTELTVLKKFKKGCNLDLDNINGKDLYKIFDSFIAKNKTDFKKVSNVERKKVYKFDSVKAIDKQRIIYGWFLEGEYGLEKELINISSSDLEFLRKIENAEITKHFFYIQLPKKQEYGLVLLHNVNGNGIKTTFHEEILHFFKPLINLHISMTPLSYDGAMKKWANAVAKEIRLNRFEPQSDITDTLKNLGYDQNANTTLILKPQIKGGNFGKLSELISTKKTNRPSKKLRAIEVMSENCEEIKTVFELEGRKRTFKIGNGVVNTLCEVICPSDLESKPSPSLVEMKDWAFEVAKEFASDIYTK